MAISLSNPPHLRISNWFVKSPSRRSRRERQPGSLDPQRAEDAFSYDVLHDLYEGLTASSPDGEVVPAGAVSWRVDEGGRRYTFTLRREARWSNDDPVLASDFVTAFRRAMDPATVSGAADLLRAIENAPAILGGERPVEDLGVQALDDYRLEIRLVQPVPYFLDILTKTVASPVHASSLAVGGGFSKPGATITNSSPPSRLKVGIGRPCFSEPVEDFVLKPFYPGHRPLVEKVIGLALQACEMFVVEGIGKTMSIINSQELAGVIGGGFCSKEA